MEIAKEVKTVTSLILIINFDKSQIYRKQKCVNSFKRDYAKMECRVISLMVKKNFFILLISIKQVYVIITIKETVKLVQIVGMHMD